VFEAIRRDHSQELVEFYDLVERNTTCRFPLYFKRSGTSCSLSCSFPCKVSRYQFGDPRIPQQGGGNVRHWPTARLYIQDTWRIRPNLTANYGLGWSIDRDLNYDLNKPALLAPLLGSGGLGPPRKSWSDFSPVLGVAWGLAAKTVIRAGAGLYYEPLSSAGLDVC
jgi:outer membrane receptor protein involved in Fe transport